MKKLFDGIFDLRRRLYTKNLTPGKAVYGEKLVNFSGEEYREWNPFRSKLGAAIRRGLKFSPFKNGSSVLYLGSAEGTTGSHVSDVIGSNGLLFGVDLAPRVMRKFILLSEKRKNMLPVLESANHPENYEKYIGKVDVVFQDVSQKNQTEIFIKNCEKFLKNKGIGLYAIKSRSINVTMNPKRVFEEQIKVLEKKFEILQRFKLEPFEKDHMFVVVRKRS